MKEHPITSMMETTMQKIREMVDVNTVVGDAITASDGTTIIPISKIKYGFGAFGSDLPTKTEKELFGGGTGMGVTIEPVGFLVIHQGETKLLSLPDSDNVANNVVKLVPEVFDRITNLFKKKSDVTPNLNEVVAKTGVKANPQAGGGVNLTDHAVPEGFGGDNNLDDLM